jgi:glycosyltransferase involved in cell wall biosynthesis
MSGGIVMKPKILYTTSIASPQSGAFRSLLYMSRSIENWGYNPILVLPESSENYAFLTGKDHEQIYFLQLPQARRGRTVGFYTQYILHNPQTVHKLVRIIRRDQISIVHINEIVDIYAALAARMTGVPCVWHVRADLAETPRVRWLLPRIVAALAHRIVVVSESVRKNLFEELQVATDKVVVIRDPLFDAERFYPTIDGSATREELGLNDDCFVVGLVGKLVEVKGHEALLRAAPLVLKSFPDTYFVIVGGEVEGKHNVKYAAGLKKLPKDLAIDDRVVLTGYRADVPHIIAACDIVTHCSVYPDPFPGVVLQGMAVGKPVIASNLGGAKEQIEDRVSGLLVNPRNPRALANAIISLLGDPQKRRALGRAAVKRVQSHFTAEAFFEKLARLYDSVLEDS